MLKVVAVILQQLPREEFVFAIVIEACAQINKSKGRTVKYYKL